MTCKWYNCCPLRTFEKQGKIDDCWAHEYCLSETNYANCCRYHAAQKGIPHPDNLLPDGRLDPKLK